MTGPDPSYTDPRLAQVYDSLNPWREDQSFYADLVGSAPCRVLDVGCGTGTLAVELARRGHDVTGADPAAAMLDIARAKPFGDQVTWVQTEAQALELGTEFDRIVLSGHAFQVFLDEAAILAALRAFRRHLAPDGILAFETRNPAFESWRSWNSEESQEIVDVPQIGPVTVHNAIVSGSRNRVTYETHFAFPDGTRHVGIGTLNYAEAPDLVRMLKATGFGEPDLYGYWDRRPIGPGEREIIVVARPA